MKPTYFIIITIFCLFLTSVFGLKIAVTIHPYYLILNELKSENIQLSLLIDASVNPHTFSPTIQQVKQLYDADIVIYNGLNLENFLEKALDELRMKGKTMVRISDSMNAAAILSGDHSTVEEGDNPHIWLDLVFLTETVIPNLADLLIRWDPENTEHYLLKRNEMTTGLKDLHQVLTEYFKKYTGGKIMMAHPSFTYFFHRYGIEVEAIFKGEGDEPTAIGLKNLLDQIRTEKILAIFMEPQQPLKYAEILVREGNSKTGTLDALGSKAKTILELFQNNIKEIKRVLP